MIKINLLAVRVPKEHQLVNKQIILFVFLLVLSIMAGVFGKGWAAEQKADAEKRLSVAKTELASFKTVERRMKELEKKKARREQILEAIKKLQAKKVGPTPYLDAINTALSPDIWLVSLGEAKGAINIVGYSFSNPGIADLMRSLDASIYFANTELKEIKTEILKKETIKSFAIATQWVVEWDKAVKESEKKAKELAKAAEEKKKRGAKGS